MINHDGGLLPEIEPFLRWAGGKRWFVIKHASLLPTHYNRYIEPFLGAGSVFFHQRPAKALLGDINSELIEAYQAIQSDWRAIERGLSYRHRAHQADPDKYYYKVRAGKPAASTTRASRLIYLNRTCFNGVYRVNRAGQFNVPRGTKPNAVLPTDNFQALAKLLKHAELRASDFEELIDEAKSGDFVFADPPYTVRHNLNGFIKYNEVLFSWADQQRLAFALRRAARRGAQIICTNANHDSVTKLYDFREFKLQATSRYSHISADKGCRRHFEEVIIRASI